MSRETSGRVSAIAARLVGLDDDDIRDEVMHDHHHHRTAIFDDIRSVAASALAQRETETAAVRDVLAERRRQIEVEGWTPEHDDLHDAGDLAGAASCYALNAASLLSPFNGTAIDEPPDAWLFGEDWWKPAQTFEEARRDLVKSAALILAEIERLDRAAACAAVDEKT